MLIKLIKNLDFYFIFGIVTLGVFGLLTMSSFEAGDQYFTKQLTWLILGLLVYVFMSSFEFSFLKDTKLVMIFYIATNFLLATTLVFGKLVKGSKAWLSLGSVSLQPADFAKLSLILLLAKYLSKRHIEIKYWRHIIVTLIYTAIPMGLTLLQPDFGSAIVIGFIWFAVVLFSGLSRKHFLTMLGIGIVTLIILWTSVFKPYQKDRILNFLDPLRDIRGSGYNVYQSQIAIGSGGLYGKGVGYGTQSRLSYLPEHETDFIFAGFAEEWGFVGIVSLIIIYLIIHFRIVYIAFRSQDNFFVFICVGVFAFIFIHTFINIAMNLGLFPVTGLPLPLMSYGGSHLLAELVALGLISSIGVSPVNIKRKISSEFLGLE
jgi:rod shape determining protein RodA